MPRTLDGPPAAGPAPSVSLGLPVYNGERFLAATLDSVLAQTYTDFELIVSDNGSTDGTERICREYAARDPRVRYLREPQNRGACFNFNRVFEESRGKYFKWVAHDDLCAPTFLERCVEALERRPEVVLSYTRARAIDEQGRKLQDYGSRPQLGSQRSVERFRASLWDEQRITSVPVVIFGLVRREALARTPLIGNYASSDGVLLGELALLGPFHEVPESLFSYRHHVEQSWVKHRERRELIAWYDPRRATKLAFPQWRLLLEHLRSIRRVPLSLRERLGCYSVMGWWVRARWRELAKNLLLRG